VAINIFNNFIQYKWAQRAPSYMTERYKEMKCSATKQVTALFIYNMSNMLILIVSIPSNKPQHVHHIYQYLIMRTFHFNYSDFSFFIKKMSHYTFPRQTKKWVSSEKHTRNALYIYYSSYPQQRAGTPLVHAYNCYKHVSRGLPYCYAKKLL
jgi:hypothetical protein